MKKIKYSIIVALVLLVTSIAYAYSHGNDSYGCKKSYSENYNKNGCKKHKYKKHNGSNMAHKGDGVKLFIKAVYSLDLKSEQSDKIKTIIRKFKNDKFKMFDTFKKDSFDKNAYIEVMNKNKENKVKVKAQLIEDIYNVLDKKQKIQIKEKIDDFKKMKDAKYDGSSCHGRR